MSSRYEQLKYINHLGEELNFGRDGIYVNQNDLHDFSWDMVYVNSKISSFERSMREHKIPVRIACDNRVDGIAKRNKLFEIPEKDVLASQYGRFVINGYYCECYVTGSTKSRYSALHNYMECELTVTTDHPVWIKESVLLLTSDPNYNPETNDGLNFPFDFPFDFLPFQNRATLVASGAVFESPFRIVIHGVAVNPTIYVNGHEYQVNTTVYSGQILTIDSNKQTIVLSNEDGSNQENAFDKRSRDYYIFQPLPAGNLDIRWDNSFDFDLYILEERSEPTWKVDVE